jgi:hypothetical protein
MIKLTKSIFYGQAFLCVINNYSFVSVKLGSHSKLALLYIASGYLRLVQDFSLPDV